MGSEMCIRDRPSPDQLIGPLQDAVAAGIPVYTLNSGLNDYQTIGATTHIGQSEDVAGQGAGQRFNDLGALQGSLWSPGAVQRRSDRALRRSC